MINFDYKERKFYLKALNSSINTLTLNVFWEINLNGWYILLINFN